MAVSIPAGVADYLKRTSGLLNPAADSTVMFWAKYGTVAPPNQDIYALLDDPAVYVDYVSISALTTFQVIEFTGPIDIVDANAPSTGTWYHLCWVQSGTTQRFYINGVLIGSDTKNRAAFTIGFELLGNDTFASGDCLAAYFRSWQDALTTAEILAEMGATQAARTADLFMDTPLASDLLDDSGNGHDWTMVGTVPFVAGPDLNSNNTAFTATALDTTGSISVDMGQGTTAWFSYTPVSSDEVVLGFWAFYDFAKVDEVLISVYEGAPATLSGWPAANPIEGLTNVPFTLPVSHGTTIYIKIYMDVASTLPYTSDLEVTTLPGPTGGVVSGSIAVNDDLEGFPIALLTETEPNTVLQHLNFRASGDGTVMPNTGEVLLTSTDADLMYLYQPDYQTVMNLPEPDVQSGTGPFNAGTDGSQLFYVSALSSIFEAWILSYDRVTGAEVARYNLGSASLRCGCPNRDNTIFYYLKAGTSDIFRWDLINDVALSALPTSVGFYHSGPDLLYLADDTIVWVAQRLSFPDQIKHVDATTGATLNTYTMPASPVVVDHLAMAIDDPNSFWVWLHNGNAATYASTFLNIRVSDGFYIVNQDATQYEFGQYGGDFATDPTARFGHSNSCPFWIARVSINPTPGLNVREYLVRRERWFPVLNQEQIRMFFSFLQVDLQAGNGLSEGQGEDPILELDWSDDGGWTWSNIRFLHTGRLGVRNVRAIGRMLGTSRQRVFRIACSDPVQWVILDGYMKMTMGTS